METITTIFTTISVLTWWHVPIAATVCSLLNFIFIIRNGIKETHYKAVLAITVIVLGLSMWNWDLHIGTSIIEKYLELQKLRF